jgi:hypothetical protein
VKVTVGYSPRCATRHPVATASTSAA